MSSIAYPKHGEEDKEKYARYRWWLGITLGDMLDKSADLYPRKEALVDDRVRLTYAALQQSVNRLAVGLIDLGLEKGDTVLLQLPNWAEYVLSYFALQKIGCIPVILVSGYRQLEVSHLCRLTEAKAWIVPDVYRKIDYLSFAGEVKKENPQLQYILSVRAAGEDSQFTTSLEKLMKKGLSDIDRHRLAARRPHPGDIAHILPSGGTTGL
ncbi:MAG: entE, partial [Deltaproteobacteria bacterium]|nr:entE [Deltaproteobacteria bacterium]